MSNINTKTYVDIHTTGKRQEFSSIRKYDKFLKEHNAYVVSRKDLEKIKSPPKSDYKQVAEDAWREKEKFVQEVKYGKRRLNAV